MTTPTLYPVRPGLVLDFNPALDCLSVFEVMIQESNSFEALAAYLLESGFRGEPLALGADPLTAALNFPLDSPARVAVHRERLRLLWDKAPGRGLPVASLDLADDYPGIVGFLYCLEDGRFLELSPPGPEREYRH